MGLISRSALKGENKCVFHTSEREREKGRDREKGKQGGRVGEGHLHIKLASLAEKRNGKNFNVILFLLTAAMS